MRCVNFEDNPMVRLACSTGRYDVAMWLRNALYMLDNENVYEARNPWRFNVFQAAFLSGQYEIATWLHASFPLTDEEVRAVNSDGYTLFQNVCHWGHVEVAKWLHATFHITPEEAKAAGGDGYTPFQGACIYDQFEVAKWLHATFHITPEEAKVAFPYGNSEFVYDLFDHEILGWLIETFPDVYESFQRRRLPPLPSGRSDATSVAARDEEQGLRAVCAVCRARPRDMRIEPCEHDEMCLECAYQWYYPEDGPQRPLICTFCTRPIDNVELLCD